MGNKLTEAQNNQLGYLKDCKMGDHQLVCTTCKSDLSPENFGQCLAFYELHQGHPTYVKKVR